jgi:phosphoglycerate dehydrogenase-like enzyme
LGVELTGLDDVFREADFLSISVPLLPETRGIVSADRIALMKPTAFLINTARGAVVDQAALTRALKERRLAGAALDVFEKEPLDPDDPLHDLDNVILTPHVLCETDQLQRGIGDSVVNSVLASMSGEVPQHIVNRAVVDSPVFKRKIDANRMTFAR